MMQSVITKQGETDLASILQAYNDVTERLKRSHEALVREVGRLREELQDKNRALERNERLSALGEMATGVAHEIRNPLGGIGLYLSVLDRDLRDRPKQLEIVRKMKAGVRNLDGIVADILTFAGDAPLDVEDVSGMALVSSVLDQLEPRVSARDIHVDVDASLGELVFQCDVGQVERALINLVMNALDAVERGGVVRIRRDRSCEASGLGRMMVEDDGPGISPELLHRIFDPFFTTKDHGTGLGLAIVHRIAEANGGSVTAGNKSEGRGAVFVLSIPLTDTSHCATNQPGS